MLWARDTSSVIKTVSLLTSVGFILGILVAVIQPPTVKGHHHPKFKPKGKKIIPFSNHTTKLTGLPPIFLTVSHAHPWRDPCRQVDITLCPILSYVTTPGASVKWAEGRGARSEYILKALLQDKDVGTGYKLSICIINLIRISLCIRIWELQNHRTQGNSKLNQQLLQVGTRDPGDPETCPWTPQGCTHTALSQSLRAPGLWLQYTCPYDWCHLRRSSTWAMPKAVPLPTILPIPGKVSASQQGYLEQEAENNHNMSITPEYFLRSSFANAVPYKWTTKDFVNPVFSEVKDVTKNTEAWFLSTGIAL